MMMMIQTNKFIDFICSKFVLLVGSLCGEQGESVLKVRQPLGMVTQLQKLICLSVAKDRFDQWELPEACNNCRCCDNTMLEKTQAVKSVAGFQKFHPRHSLNNRLQHTRRLRPGLFVLGLGIRLNHHPAADWHLPPTLGRRDRANQNI